MKHEKTVCTFYSHCRVAISRLISHRRRSSRLQRLWTSNLDNPLFLFHYQLNKISCTIHDFRLPNINSKKSKLIMFMHYFFLFSKASHTYNIFPNPRKTLSQFEVFLNWNFFNVVFLFEIFCYNNWEMTQ